MLRLNLRPTLAAAARLGVPVFAHPVAPQPLIRQMAPYGVVGTLFARGAVNAACLIALVEGGVFGELPALRVVVTGHAIGGLAMASGLSRQSRAPGGTVATMREHVFIDTQLIYPALIRAAVDLIGADRVLAGSDWPIVDDGPIGARSPMRWRPPVSRQRSSRQSLRAIACGRSVWRMGRRHPDERNNIAGCAPMIDSGTHPA